tara:strand:+ start:1200 stop:1343 length:144 start_codon:yes stop_codon:yes gene_type:complete
MAGLDATGDFGFSDAVLDIGEGDLDAATSACFSATGRMVIIVPPGVG